MTKDRSPASKRPENAGDVVDGPVGAASLRQPPPSGPDGVDLEALASIHVQPGQPAHESRSSARDAGPRPERR